MNASQRTDAAIDEADDACARDDFWQAFMVAKDLNSELRAALEAELETLYA